MARKPKKSAKLTPEKAKELADLLDQMDWGQSTLEDLSALDIILDSAQAIFLASFDLKQLGEEALRALEDLREAMRLSNYDPGMCDLSKANADREIITTAFREIALDEPHP